ncbi:condensation domain-containing protein, partial [Methylosinus sp. Sm6]|uniref:condensation domain-containing protein n=1 Tax=Methylosinus sp. Sm6 TaxID=2866948 RepID=UPI001E0A3677
IWAELLGVERVGRNDNFFELGGHSLLAVTLIERMRRRGMQADVRALFVSPTLADFATAAAVVVSALEIPPNRIPANCAAITPEMLPLIDLAQSDIDRIVATVPGGAANVQDIYPLTPLQEGIFFHHLTAAERDVYLLDSILSFDTRDRLDRFVAAMNALIARHDVLRTAVVWEGLPEPVQVVWRTAALTVEDVGFDPANGEIAEQLRARFDSYRYRLDLKRAPLMRSFA